MALSSDCHQAIVGTNAELLIAVLETKNIDKCSSKHAHTFGGPSSQTCSNISYYVDSLWLCNDYF